MKAIAVGGQSDHVHLLLALQTSQTVAGAMRIIKSGSSRWMHETAGSRLFAWQQGYGAFSVGSAQMDATIAYIARQKEHHSRRDFQAEFLAILRKHSLEYDLERVWD